MTNIDLNSYTSPDLRQLMERVKTELAARHQQDLTTAKAQIHAIAESVGLSAVELMGKETAAGKTGAKVAAKYRHPDDADKTWSGRGRQPIWVVAMSAAGTLESARIAAVA